MKMAPSIKPRAPRQEARDWREGCKVVSSLARRSEFNVSHRNTLLCLGAEKLSRRKKQHRTEEWDQHPPCVCLRNNRDMSVSISICIVIAPAVFVFLFPLPPVVIALFALFAIVVGIRQDGEN